MLRKGPILEIADLFAIADLALRSPLRKATNQQCTSEGLTLDKNRQQMHEVKFDAKEEIDVFYGELTNQFGKIDSGKYRIDILDEVKSLSQIGVNIEAKNLEEVRGVFDATFDAKAGQKAIDADPDLILGSYQIAAEANKWYPLPSLQARN